MANATELRATMDDIEADPEGWDQAWVVVPRGERGATYCFGGRTLVRNGYAPISRKWDLGFRSPDGNVVNSLGRAAAILELKDNEREALFFNMITDMAEMRALVEAIITGDTETVGRYLE